MKNTEL